MESENNYPIQFEYVNDLISFYVKQTCGHRDVCKYVSEAVISKMVLNKTLPALTLNEYTYIKNRLCEIVFDMLNGRVINEILIPKYKK